MKSRVCYHILLYLHTYRNISPGDKKTLKGKSHAFISLSLVSTSDILRAINILQVLCLCFFKDSRAQIIRKVKSHATLVIAGISYEAPTTNGVACYTCYLIYSSQGKTFTNE